MGVEITAQTIVDKLVDDMQDRRGLGDSWDEIDERVRAEIKEAWTKIISKEVSKLLK